MGYIDGDRNLYLRPHCIFLIMYDSVLLPIDDSPGAKAAIEHATRIARRYDAVIHIIHVLEVTDLGDFPDDIRDIDSIEDALQLGGREMLKPVRHVTEAAGLETVEVLKEGKAHQKLIEYVDTHDIDLVVMGTHGKSGLSRVLLGSTTEKVVRHSSAPVLTVPVPDG